jgi:hypothetical protein
MNVKDKVIKILANICIQTNSSIIRKMIKDIYSDKLLDNKNVYMRKRFLLIFCQKWPELKVSSEDIEYVINYLESIEIMQKLNE